MTEHNITFGTALTTIICMSGREIDDEGLPRSSPKRKSDKYSKLKK
jgi:hypothetical protein